MKHLSGSMVGLMDIVWWASWRAPLHAQNLQVGKGVISVVRQVVDPVVDKLDPGVDPAALPLTLLLQKAFKGKKNMWVPLAQPGEMLAGPFIFSLFCRAAMPVCLCRRRRRC